jgi:hypothetical protein
VGSYGRPFRSTLFRYAGKGGWTFVPVPVASAPPVTRGWGRTPVWACVDGREWATSVWRGKDGRPLLAVPARMRPGKGHGDVVRVRLARRDEDGD